MTLLRLTRPVHYAEAASKHQVSELRSLLRGLRGLLLSGLLRDSATRRSLVHEVLDLDVRRAAARLVFLDSYGALHEHLVPD